MKQKLEVPRNQPKLTQFVQRFNEEGKMKKPEEDEDSEEDRRDEEKKPVQESKPEEKTKTQTDDQTNPEMAKPSPPEQPQMINRTSVKSKVLAFTQKFKIPPKNQNPPPPPKLTSEPTPLPEKKRRPRKLENSASEHIEIWEGNYIEKNVMRNKIGGLEGKGKILTNLDQ